MSTLVFMVSINPVVNDDAYVYFNYARNFAEGRFFAYDLRNIPSEGFTSLIFLLALVPFELLGINPFLGAIVINSLAVFASIGILGWLLHQTRFSDLPLVLIACLLPLLLLKRDDNIMQVMGFGLDTMLGVLVVMLAILGLGLALDNQLSQRRRSRYLKVFFGAGLAAYLIRPEYFVFIMPVGGLLLLAAYPDRKEVIRKSIGIGGIFVIYNLAKLAIFHDLWPTGFYRKVSGTVSSSSIGADYVANWTEAYTGLIYILAGLLIVAAGIMFLRRMSIIHQAQAPLDRQYWIFFAVVISFGILFFFTRTTPLVGVGYRYLIVPTFMLYTISIFLAIEILQTLIRQFVPQSHREQVAYGLAICLSIGIIAFMGGCLYKGGLTRLNLVGRIETGTTEHLYLQLGNYLKSKIPDHEDIVVVFGDAGAIPYSFESRFIDSNGLTEPPIAHLFQLPNGAEKTRQFIDYVLSNRPDLVMLGYGRVKNNIWTDFPNNHSPFTGYTPIEVYNSYRDYGISYVCSIRSYSDLHIGIRQGTVHTAALTAALRSYCADHGYTLDSYTVAVGDQTVTFPTAK